jgi:hypothetical protein
MQALETAPAGTPLGRLDPAAAGLAGPAGVAVAARELIAARVLLPQLPLG